MSDQPPTTQRDGSAPRSTTPNGTPKPPSARVRHNTAHEIQVTSQEIEAESGLVPDEATVERRVILKRVGRAMKAAKSSDVWTKRSLAAVGLFLLVGDDLKIWAKAHAETAWGLVGLGGILITGALAYTRFFVRSEATGDEGGPGPPPAST